MMIRLSLAVLAVAELLAGASATAPALAAEFLAEAPLATRVVLVGDADLTSKARLAAIERKLSAAALAVCREQYRADESYYLLRACYTGTFREALGQLRELQARQLASHSGAGVRIAITSRRK